jgi:hypothetical protein
MPVRFYNPGPAMNERLRYDNPIGDPKESNMVSGHILNVPEKDFFDVPTEIRIDEKEGEFVVPVKFADRVQALYRHIGIVRINPNPKRPIEDDDNVALNEKDAREKGERLWRDCMIDMVRAHTQQCAEIRSHNNIPTRARGTTAQAFRTLGIEDPANDVADVLSRKQDVSEVAELRRQLEELKTLMLTGAKAGK